MNADVLHSQEHRFLNGLEISLGELFNDLGVMTINRFSPDTFETVAQKLKTGEEYISLFNTTNPVNNHLLGQGEHAGVIACIYGPNGVIDGSSLQVVRVLETDNVSLETIDKRGLFTESIPGANSGEEMMDWLGRVFYKGRDISGENSLLYRLITRPY